MAGIGTNTEAAHLDETPVLIWVILSIIVLSIAAFLVLQPSPSGRGHRATSAAVMSN